jgi:hypothetical protein
MLRLQITASLSLVVGLLVSTPAIAADDIRVLRQAPVSENITLPIKVKEECGNLGLDLPSELSRSFKAVKLVKEAKELKGKGKYLEIMIIDVVAKQGSVFSGPKKMTVRGTLYENGKEVGDFEGQRSSAVSSFSTCESLSNVEKRLGQDIAKWLHNPKPGSRL